MGLKRIDSNRHCYHLQWTYNTDFGLKITVNATSNIIIITRSSIVYIMIVQGIFTRGSIIHITRIAGESAIEATVNCGHNHNSRKVAKFLLC